MLLIRLLSLVQFRRPLLLEYFLGFFFPVSLSPFCRSSRSTKILLNHMCYISGVTSIKNKLVSLPLKTPAFIHDGEWIIKMWNRRTELWINTQMIWTKTSYNNVFSLRTLQDHVARQIRYRLRLGLLDSYPPSILRWRAPKRICYVYIIPRVALTYQLHSIWTSAWNERWDEMPDVNWHATLPRTVVFGFPDRVCYCSSIICKILRI